MQVEDHGKIQLAFARPDIADVARPFLIGHICHKVTVKQVGCNVEPVIAIRCHLVFACSDDGYAVLAHQSANTAVPHI